MLVVLALLDSVGASIHWSIQIMWWMSGCSISMTCQRVVLLGHLGLLAQSRVEPSWKKAWLRNVTKWTLMLSTFGGRLRAKSPSDSNENPVIHLVKQGRVKGQRMRVSKDLWTFWQRLRAGNMS